MKEKKFNSFSGLVYSTNPDAMQQQEEVPESTPDPGTQKLKILLDKKQRKGKVVTLIIGFVGNEHDLEELGKKLKVKCGTGGSAKDGEIIIQGDYKEIVAKWLKEWGYGVIK